MYGFFMQLAVNAVSCKCKQSINHSYSFKIVGLAASVHFIHINLFRLLLVVVVVVLPAQHIQLMFIMIVSLPCMLQNGELSKLINYIC